MRNQAFAYSIAVFVFLQMFLGPTIAQDKDWRDFQPLLTTLTEFEAVLGEPDWRIGSYRTYKTDFGNFSVWYTSGKCEPKNEGRDYNVAAERLGRLLVYPNTREKIPEFLTESTAFEKTESVSLSGRLFYTSTDNLIQYQSVIDSSGKEIIYSIELMPSKRFDNLLCGRSDEHWKSIVPLQTTCEEVETLYEVPACDVDQIRIQRKEYSITIWFTADSEETSAIRRVKVMSVSFTTIRSVDEHGFDLSEFPSVIETDVEDLFEYTDPSRGLELTVQRTPLGDLLYGLYKRPPGETEKAKAKPLFW